MIRRLTMSTLLAIAATAGALAADVKTYTSGGTTFYFTVNSDNITATITNKNGDDTTNVSYSTAAATEDSYNAYSGDITIPSNVSYNSTEYTVSAIGAYAFMGCTSLGAVTAPSALTEIGNYAFADKYTTSGRDTTTLSSIDLSTCTKLSKIGKAAFRNCSSLTDIVLPGCGEMEIAAQCFSSSNTSIPSLSAIKMPYEADTITLRDNALIRLTDLTSLELNTKKLIWRPACVNLCASLFTVKCTATEVECSTSNSPVFFFQCGSNGSKERKVYVRPYMLSTYGTGYYSLGSGGYGLTTYYPYYDLTVSSAEAATLCLPFTSTIPDGVKLYTLDKVTTSTNKYVAVGTDITDDADTLTYDRPVYVTAEAGTYEFLGYYGGSDSKYHLTAQTETATEGVLTGVYQATTAEAGVYVLQDQGDGAQFYPVKSGSSITIGQFRAYLTYDEDSSAKSISFGFNDEDADNDSQTTDISGVSVAESSLDAVYTLQGVRVSEDNLQRGIYIRDGKKFVVK